LLNPAEVGDSYRFLNAGDFLSRLSYPNFEKRLPLFPLFLSLGIRFIDPITWGRLVAQAISLLVLFLTYKIGFVILQNKNKAFLAVVITALSPLFFYGTSRILSEGLFSLLLLVSIFLYLKRLRNYFLIGVVCGLCFLTRYEGALIAFSYGVDLVIKKDWKNIAKMLIGFFVVSGLWIARVIYLYTSLGNFEYASEPFGFDYSPKSILVVASSFLFLFGNLFISPVVLIRDIKSIFMNYRPIVLYIFLSILFFFLWIAAMPRLFTYLIPIFSIFVLNTIKLENLNRKAVLLFCSLLLQFLVFRFLYRYHFLVLGKELFIFFIMVSLLSFFAILFVKRKLAILLIVISSIVSSLSYTYHYRNVYQTVYKANLFLRTLDGKIAFSDETGVSSWYLKNSNTLYFDSTSGEESVDYLRSQNVKWALVTNEFDEYRRLVFLEKKENKNDVFLIAKFQENDGGYIRYSKIYKIIYKNL
jgi:hypothetical protein